MTTAELSAKVAALEKKVKTQAKELTLLKDIEAVKRLQRAYCYYVEHMMYREIVDCFADSDDVMLDWLEGKWVGKKGVDAYFAALKNTPADAIHQVMPIAGIVDIDAGGRTASGRWYVFGGQIMPRADGSYRRSFVGGIYENRYIKEKGTWKILSIKWTIPYALRHADGWAMPEDVAKQFLEGQRRGPAPDVPLDREDGRYLSGYIFPFHYSHPVTGMPTSETEKNKKLKETRKK